MSEQLTLPVRSRSEFRQALAEIVDPDRQMSAMDRASFQPVANRAVVLLCRVFGSVLDKKTLWTRIDSGLVSACAKVSDGDTEQWLCLLFDHVRGEIGTLEEHEHADLLGLLADLSHRDATYRKGFVRWVETRRTAVMAHGRQAWAEWKQTNSAPAAAREGGAA
ncbi:hypothetical protein VT84_09480 [Gemmata sp. SH-PL17]|uniref:hypothetical protein n=1 Tax=Gemmata sp. SH-PL17 TaxID=1630693 RepID=UPI00078D5A2F|nr:hypothetical protein [Gemmata sp. SH-PL17]AMV24615.1 hypothetical protein VT84_09480 [Gemmata sp. SH-PL17]